MKKIIIVSTIFLGIMLIPWCIRNKEGESIVDNEVVINNEIVEDDSYISFDKEFNYGNISEEVKNVVVNYPGFLASINQADMNIPIIENMVPQGIALMGDYILITAYDSEEEKNSVVYVLDALGNIINTVNLENKSHVGGIAYDKINNLIWIPDNNGVLNAYLATDFLNKKKVKYKYRFNNVSEELIDFLDKSKKLIAFLTVDDEYIYFGNFAKEEKSLVKKYKVINIDGSITLNYVSSFMVPAKTQSIAFFNKGEKKYMIMSSSYQRRKSSYIKVYEYSDNVSNYEEVMNYIELPPMLEQLAISGNSIYTIFESKARKYNNCPEKMGYICILDIYKILK